MYNYCMKNILLKIKNYFFPKKETIIFHPTVSRINQVMNYKPLLKFNAIPFINKEIITKEIFNNYYDDDNFVVPMSSTCIKPITFKDGRMVFGNHRVDFNLSYGGGHKQVTFNNICRELQYKNNAEVVFIYKN